MNLNHVVCATTITVTTTTLPHKCTIRLVISLHVIHHTSAPAEICSTGKNPFIVCLLGFQLIFSRCNNSTRNCIRFEQSIHKVLTYRLIHEIGALNLRALCGIKSIFINMERFANRFVFWLLKVFVSHSSHLVVHCANTEHCCTHMYSSALKSCRRMFSDLISHTNVRWNR